MDEAGEPWRWRPEPWWLMLSLLGAAAGGLVGAGYVVVLVAVEFGGTGALNGDPGGSLVGVLGLAVFGAVCGALVGLASGAVVGLVLTFLVGRDMPGRPASALAFGGAAVTAAVVLWPVLTSVLDVASYGTRVVLVSAAAALAGAVAVWFRRQLPHRPRLAEVHAH